MMDHTLSRFLNRAIVVALMVVVGIYLYCWRFGYHSDVALIGLMAKSILNRQQIPDFQWPIFVWKVGYQGILLEVYSLALAFTVFGVSPFSLNLVPSLFFILLVFTFYRVLRLSYGQTMAQLSTLFLSISSPYLFFRVLRTQPNYVEVFILGVAFIGVYLKWLGTGSFSKAKGPALAGVGRRVYVPLLGFLAGFGLYTYGQMIFFIGCAGLHFVLVQLKRWHPHSRDLTLETIWRRALPRRLPGLFYVLLGIAGILLFVGIPSFFVLARGMKLGSVIIKWDALTMIRDGCALLVLASIPYWLKVIPRSALKVAVVPCFLFGVFFLVGYAPTLYYTHVLGLPTSGKFGVGGDLAIVLPRIVYAYQAALNYFNFIPFGNFNWVGPFAAWWTFFSLAYFTYSLGLQILRAFRAGGLTSADEFLKISPLAFLPLVVGGAYLVSSNGTDIESGRYTVAILLTGVMAQAHLIHALFTLPRVRSARYLAILGFITIIMHNSLAIGESVAAVESTHFSEDIAAYLEENMIQYGYGDYWVAYALNFLTDEEIVIEPLANNFCPYYAPRVKKARRLALIEFLDKLKFSSEVGTDVEIAGQKFLVEQVKDIRGLRVSTLLRIM